jgi:hypothetical protein
MVQAQDKQVAASTSGFESDAASLSWHPTVKKLGIVETIRVSLTTTALLFGITILAVSADALTVYNNTHLPADFLLPLWPDHFDIRPTIALVVGSSIVNVSNIISLVFTKVDSLRTRQTVHSALTVAAPAVGFIVAIVAVALFYAINASTTADTMQSWTCRWEAVVMTVPPNFGTLCKEAKTGLYMSILLIPLEIAVLGLAGWQLIAERQLSGFGFRARKAGSPVPS